MDRNTPYTVPEGFFETTRKCAIESGRRIRRRRRLAIGLAAGIAAALAITLMTPSEVRESERFDYIPEEAMSGIADLYTNDIFLNNF